ncbi:hypothetical protein [Brevibacillus laterosporus]|uniref:hypothetical protein n=1 Tax=Brevibacillus laterosporus TaxID=1465 RepID=UPI003D1A4B95
MQLDSLVYQVSLIEKAIKEVEYAMRHASPHSVNTLRQQKEELQYFLEVIMNSCVNSNFDLESMLAIHGDCVRDCFRPFYTGKPVTLPKPKWDTPPPPPPPEPPVATVPGVNLILYIDTSGSMLNALRGSLKVQLINFANYLKGQSTRANIPCTCSIVWYGDATDAGGDGRNSYYTISMNKEDVANFPTKIANPVYYRGGYNRPESGILAIKESLNQVYKNGVQNTLIYITDAESKANEMGATPSMVKKMFVEKDIQAYGIIPTKREPNINDIFKDVREFTSGNYNMIPWADKTLRP